ncbi:hypothetical protein QYM36_000382 [Artemia franciscana]|uniref:Uncharacterized protein n=1 Tax=Artemia franciscana TaxID=6661 RepID=A0AA88IEP4_ARTSF|nr:hypothetical protein QYM36_000382 [Artemia franciscana]
MHRYFPNDIDTQQWICNPFSIEMEEISFLNLKAQEEFAELTSDPTLRLRFSQVPVHEFWIEIKAEYPLLSEMTMNKLLPFVQHIYPRFNYLCKNKQSHPSH